MGAWEFLSKIRWFTPTGPMPCQRIAWAFTTKDFRITLFKKSASKLIFGSPGKVVTLYQFDVHIFDSSFINNIYDFHFEKNRLKKSFYGGTILWVFPKGNKIALGRIFESLLNYKEGKTLRKFITVLLLTISMFSFFILYNEQKELQIYNMKNAEHHLQNSYEINIPSKINSLPRGTQYTKLLETSSSNDASMYFSRIENINGQVKIIKYFYSPNDEYMNQFKLVWGKKLDKTLMDTDYFLSTDDTGDKNQIGRIASFNGIHMEIHTLQGMLDSGLFLDGPCTITLPDKDNINSLSSQFLKWLNIKHIDVTQSYDIGKVKPNSYVQISVLFFVIMLLVLYDILKSYKNIAIEKLLGFSTFQIWKKRISKIISIQMATMLISIIIMSLVLFQEFNVAYLYFLKDLAILYGILIAIIFIVASLPFIYVNNIEVSAAIKNKQPIKEIIFFNTIVKIILCLGLIFLVNSQIANYDNIKKIFDGTYKTWESVSNYRVMNLTKNSEASYFSDNNIPIYKYFNERGGIFASFERYRKLTLDYNKHLSDYDISAVVNPNYLEENPIYNLDGKNIAISERNSNWVLLVPVKYKKDESQIRSFYQKWIDSTMTKSKLEIIWTKDNQKAFSYDINVYPENGYYVTDPILFVGTEDGAFPEWNTQIFNVAGNPFKVKIPANENDKAFIEAGLDKFGYLSYGLQINHADEEVTSKISEYKNMFIWLITSIFLILIIIGVVLIQNVYNFFEQFKIRIAIRKLHGYKKVSKYKEYLILLAISWIIVVIASFVISSFRIFALTKVILTVSAIGFIIETIISFMLLNLIEKKKITKIIKGGI